METTMTDPRDLSYATEDEMLAKEVAADVRVHHGHDSGRDEAPPIEADPRDVDGTTADVERAARSGERDRGATSEGATPPA